MSQNDVYTEPAPLPADTPLRIYSNPICPYVQRVRLLAAAKGIKTQEINIHLQVKPDWYVEKINPVGKVPTIEHNGHLVPESLIAFDYINEVFNPEDSYWPKDPYRKAVARLFVDEFGNKFIPNFYKHYKGASEEQTQELVNFVNKIEQGLKQHVEHTPDVKPFLGGMEGKPRAVDFLVWPWLERLDALSVYVPKVGSLITKEKFPNFFDYFERMKQDEAVKQSYLPQENHLAFIKSAVGGGAHNYAAADVHGTGVTIYTKK